MMNGNAEPHLNLVDDKTSNKAPWVEELKMNQAKKNSAQGKIRLLLCVTMEWTKLHVNRAVPSFGRPW